MARSGQARQLTLLARLRRRPLQAASSFASPTPTQTLLSPALKTSFLASVASFSPLATPALEGPVEIQLTKLPSARRRRLLLRIIELLLEHEREPRKALIAAKRADMDGRKDLLFVNLTTSSRSLSGSSS